MKTKIEAMIARALEARIEIVKQAIMKLREAAWVNHYLMKYPLTYGVIGVLDYIRTGDTTKILEPTLRKEIEETELEFEG